MSWSLLIPQSRSANAVRLVGSHGLKRKNIKAGRARRAGELTVFGDLLRRG